MLLIAIAGMVSGIKAFFSKKISDTIGMVGIILGSIFGLVYSISTLLSHSSEFFYLPVPFLDLNLTLYRDPLSSFFLILIFALALLCTIYGEEYLNAHGNQNKMWFPFGLLVASMAMVTISGDAIIFLVSWELMALSSFFLVAYDWGNTKSSRASWIYLSFSQIGVAALIVFFLYLWKQAGAPDFEHFKTLQLGHSLNVLFILALIGFGSKAGIVPFHIWLPEAHPAAPTHVSALMSGIMIKIGIYGLLRALSFLGSPDIWWGTCLIAIGAVSGILGVLLAIAQHDIKRLLAYHSVENIGIIVMGMGVGVIGIATSSPVLATLGFAGGLLHVCNHALFKSLLFLSAGSVILQTNTREINHMGGLIKVLPITAMAFLIGSLAIAGIPPFNGFVSEFLIYGASFLGLHAQSIRIALLLSCVILSLALIGGLALLCFTKAFGIIFLGESRNVALSNLEENRWRMTFPMIFLAFLCISIGIVPLFTLQFLGGPLQIVLGTQSAVLFDHAHLHSFLTNLTRAAVSFSAVFIAVFLIRKMLAKGKTVQQGLTWDCGFVKSSPRLQYTASSFAFSVIDLFSGVLRTKKHGPNISDYFPGGTSLSAHTVDVAENKFYKPFYRLTKSFSNTAFHAFRGEDTLVKTIYEQIKKGANVIFNMLRVEDHCMKAIYDLVRGLLRSTGSLILGNKRRVFFLFNTMRSRLAGIRRIQQGDARIYVLYIVVILCIVLAFL